MAGIDEAWTRFLPDVPVSSPVHTARKPSGHGLTLSATCAPTDRFSPHDWSGHRQNKHELWGLQSPKLVFVLNPQSSCLFCLWKWSSSLRRTNLSHARWSYRRRLGSLVLCLLNQCVTSIVRAHSITSHCWLIPLSSDLFVSWPFTMYHWRWFSSNPKLLCAESRY